MAEDKLMRYAELLEAGETEEAEKLIDSDSNLAEAIWPFHATVSTMGLSEYSWPDALRMIRASHQGEP